MNTLGSNAVQTRQGVTWVDFYYRTRDDDEWVRLEEAYKLGKSEAKGKDIVCNACDVIIEGAGITACQQLKQYDPHRPPPDQRKKDFVRWSVKLEIGGEILLGEKLVDNSRGGFQQIEIQVGCLGIKESTGDSLVKDVDVDESASDPAAALQALNAQAQTMPLAQWAENFTELGVRQVRLVLKRSFSKKSGASKRWSWPRVFDFLCGKPSWQPTTNKAITDKWVAMPLDKLKSHPVSGLRLEIQGDLYKLLAPPAAQAPPHIPEASATQATEVPTSSTPALPTTPMGSALLSFDRQEQRRKRRAELETEDLMLEKLIAEARAKRQKTRDELARLDLEDWESG